MKKKRKTGWAISLLLLMGVFACVLISCKKTDTTVGNIDVGKVDAGDIDAGDISVKNSQDKLEKTVDSEFVFRDITDLSKLVTQDEVGNIKLQPSKDSNLNVKAKTVITVFNKKDMEHIQNNIDVKKSTDKDSCTLTIVSKDSGNDLWKWLKKEVGKNNVSVSLTIEVPANFKDFQLTTECGSIQIAEVNGSMNLKAEIGNIRIDQCQLKDNCVLQTDTGNIDLSLCKKLDSSASIDVAAHTGNVGIQLNGNSVDYSQKENSSIKASFDEKYSVSAKTKTGLIRLKD